MGTVRLHQFTDPHLFGDPAGRLRGQQTLPALVSVVRHAAATAPQPAAVLLTGDLVHDDPGGYARLAEVFAGSAVPVLAIPGNHDEPAALRAALARPPFQVEGDLLVGDWVVVMLSSFLAEHADGELDAATLQRLDGTLARHAGRPALVALHHHPVPLDSRWLDEVALRNAAAFWAIADRHANLRAVAWGHVHQAFDAERTGPHGPVRLLGTPSTCAQFLPRSDDFRMDTRPPAWRWIDLHADGRVDTAVEWVP